MLIIPQALAYATLCNLPPITGLQTSFFPILFYTLLGTSNQLAVGPEGLFLSFLFYHGNIPEQDYDTKTISQKLFN